MAITAAAIAAITISSSHRLPTMLAFNGSASAPTGFYLVDQRPYRKGDYVLVSPPNSIRKLVLTRRYLPPGTPLIKQIAAVNGDTVCWKNAHILINSEPVAAVREKDSKGRSLPSWRGCLVLSEQQIFLLQPHPESFDSRYFGPVNRSRVIGRATLLRLW